MKPAGHLPRVGWGESPSHCGHCGVSVDTEPTRWTFLPGLFAIALLTCLLQPIIRTPQQPCVLGLPQLLLSLPIPPSSPATSCSSSSLLPLRDQLRSFTPADCHFPPVSFSPIISCHLLHLLPSPIPTSPHRPPPPSSTSSSSSAASRPPPAPAGPPQRPPPRVHCRPHGPPLPHGLRLLPAVSIAVVHDLAEAVAGDITPHPTSQAPARRPSRPSSERPSTP